MRSIPLLLLLWLLAAGSPGCAPPPSEETGGGPATAGYIPLARLLEPVEGPLLAPAAEGNGARIFQSVVRRDGRVRASRRISADGWFVPGGGEPPAPAPDTLWSHGILHLAPRQRGEMFVTRADFSSGQVDLVVIGVESPGPASLVFAWDCSRPGEELRLGNTHVMRINAAGGVREYLVPVRRLPGWSGRLRAFGLRADHLEQELTVHHLHFVTTGFVEALRREPGQGGLHRGRLELNDESRPVHYAPAGTVLRAGIHVPAGAFLELGFGLCPSARKTVGAAVVFRVEAENTDGRVRVLFDGDLGPGQEESRQWNDCRLPLEDFAGEEITIRLVTSTDSPPAPPAGDRPADRFGDHAVWSSPAVVVRDSRFDPHRRNVILVLADSLRPDRLSCYGAARRTSPHLGRLASRGLLFTTMRSQAPWTAPSIGSLFTSLYPSRHGAERDREALLPGSPTLAGDLAAAGFHTKGFITNITVSAQLNFDRGFDSYTYLRPSRGRPYTGARTLFSRVFGWLEQFADRPFFLYIHTMDPHSPYVVGAPFDRMFHRGGQDDQSFDAATRQYRNRKLKGLGEEDLYYLDVLYDGEIALGDHFLGRLMALLRRLDLDGNTTVIFTSDHGEEFLDHGGWGHARTLYGEQINVPLVVVPPSGSGTGRQAGSRIVQPARLVDLYPTVLGILGVEPGADGANGREDRPLIGRTGALEVPPADAFPIFAEVNKNEHLLFSVQEQNFKFIRRVSPGAGDELYDLQADAGERRNVLDEHPELARRLAAWGEAVWSERRAARARVEPDRETEQRLRALGYVE